MFISEKNKFKKGCKVSKKRGKWTLDDAILTAKQSQNYTDWVKKYPGANAFCRKNNYMDIIHGIIPPTIKKWTEKELWEISLLCETKQDLRRMNHSAYKAISLRPELRKKVYARLKATQSKTNENYLYLVYSCTFSDGAVYIGITSNYAQRVSDHTAEKSNSPINTYKISNPHLTFIFDIIEENLKGCKAVTKEEESVKALIAAGRKVLNHPNGKFTLGGGHKWSNELLKHTFMQYNTVKELKEYNATAYSIASMRGLISEFTKHMNKREYTKWTIDSAKGEISKHKTVAEWMNSGGSYHFLQKRGLDPANLFSEYHNKKRLVHPTSGNKKWTINLIHQEFLKYKRIVDVINNSPNAYSAAIRHNCLKLVSSHMSRG